MKAKHILLTHFSQRYPKMPQSQASSGVDPAAPDPIIALAFDHLSIPIGSLWKMSKYTEAIQRCFLDGEEDHDAVDQDEESSNAGGKRRSAEIGGVKPVLKRMKMA
jgi:ribonuclease Z